MKRGWVIAIIVAGVLVAAGVVVLLGGRAWGFLDTGTLLTNSASATYMAGSQGTSVTYSATAKILVANPAIYVWKFDAVPSYVGTLTGGLVRFRICFSNGGANSAFNLLIYDHLPPNTYIPSCAAGDYEMYVSGGTTTIEAQYANSMAGPWTTYVPPSCTPITYALWLRWRVGMLGLRMSGCISFNASIAP